MMRLVIFALVSASAAAFAPNMASTSRTFATPSVMVSSSSPLSFRSSDSRTERQAMLQQTELPEKLYIPQEKEIPKILGGLRIGLRKLVVITGASSGLGLNTAVTLAKSGRYFVVMAVRDVEKGKRGESISDMYTRLCLVTPKFV